MIHKILHALLKNIGGNLLITTEEEKEKNETSVVLHVKKNHFVQNMRKMVLIPFLLLILISVIFTVIAQYYIHQRFSSANQAETDFIANYIGGIIHEVSSLHYAFDNNISLARTLKEILRKETISYEERQVYTIVQTTMLSQMYTKLYIDSLYLYYNNSQERFFVTDVFHSGSYLGHLSNFSDTVWFDDYQRASQKQQRFWTERREIETSVSSTVPSKSVISVFNCLYTSGTPKSVGVFVANLDCKYLESSISEMLSSSQNIWVFNEQRELVLCASDNSIPNSYLASLDLENLPGKLFIEQTSYDLYASQDNDLGWYYVMLTKNSDELSIVSIPLFFIICISVIAILIQAFTTSTLAKKNYDLVQNILLILESAEKGKPFPPLSKAQNEIDAFVHTSLVNFIENKYYKTSQKKDYYHLQVLELLALQNQMSPHFLFNVLHTINWKAISLTHSENDVSRMIETLSSILRYSLREPLQTVSLKEEIYITKCYLQIENMQHGNKYQNVEWRCNVNPEQYKVPKFIIQPLVENCIQHAFSQSKGECKIRIRISEKNQILEIRISDNGTGINPKVLKEILHNLNSYGSETFPTEHMGIINVHKRLQLLFRAKAKTKIISIPQYGTSVQITIPTDLKTE